MKITLDAKKWVVVASATLMMVAVGVMVGHSESEAATTPTGGTVHSWGSNEYGLLGDGSLTGPQTCAFYQQCSESPIAIPHLSGVKAVAVGGQSGLALLVNSTVKAWGDNQSGELGIGNATGPNPCICSESPVVVHGLSGVVAVAVGFGFDMALLSNGTVKAWGLNEDGELGIGTHTGPDLCEGAPCSTLPVTVRGLSGVIAISAGGEDGMALLRNGTVKSWGNNGEGELGTGTIIGPQTCDLGAGFGEGPYSCSSTPVAVAGLSGVKAITNSAGVSSQSHALALLTNGTVKAWGLNGGGALGIGSHSGPSICYGGNPCSPKVVSVADLTGVKSISSSTSQSFAVLTDGTVRAWGWGYLGNGIDRSEKDRPTKIVGLSGVRIVSAGDENTLALLNTGTIKAWGDNFDGQLGDNTSSGPEICPSGDPCSPVPVSVSGLWGVASVASGGFTDLAIGGTDATIKVASVTYPSMGSDEEQVVVTGAGFSPGGKFWVGVNPQEDPLTYCGGPGQGGWCALRPTASATGTFSVTIPLADIPVGCPPDFRVDATDLTTNVGSNEVLSRPGGCVSTIPVGGGPEAVSSDGSRAWVANSDGDTVTEINTSSGSLVNTIPVGNDPFAVSTDTSHIWVANLLDNTVTEIDASNDSVVNTIPVGRVPIALSSDASHVWVANAGDDTVTEIDASDGSVVDTIPVDNEPTAVSSDGSHVWVTIAGDDTVTEIDASDGSVVNTIPVGNEPTAVSSDRSHVWVANFGDNTVTEIDASDGSVVNTIPVGNEPTAVSSDGSHVWVANFGDNTVTEIDASDGSVVNTIPVGNEPTAVSSDRSHVWVANGGDDTVTEIDA